MNNASTTSEAGGQGAAPSAMWLWSTTPTEVAEVVQFVAERQIRTVFLGVGWKGPDPHIVSLARQLREAEVGVQCLGGDQKWLAEPHLARQWLERALSPGVFDAVHLDVEPWTIKPWWAVARVRLLNQYLALLRVVGEPGLPLEVDVAPRLATDKAGTRHALDAVLDLVDRVTVMAYRDTAEGADGILGFSRLARATCSDRKIDFRIGVETQPAERAGGPRQTFAEEGRAALEREAAVVSSNLSANPFYCGVAVHDWHHWRGLT